MASLLLAVFPTPINHRTSAWQAQLSAAAHPLGCSGNYSKTFPRCKNVSMFFLPHCSNSHAGYCTGSSHGRLLFYWLWSVRNPEHPVWVQAVLPISFATSDLSLDFPKLPYPWKEDHSNHLDIHPQGVIVIIWSGWFLTLFLFWPKIFLAVWKATDPFSELCFEMDNIHMIANKTKCTKIQLLNY